MKRYIPIPTETEHQINVIKKAADQERRDKLKEKTSYNDRVKI